MTENLKKKKFVWGLVSGECVTMGNPTDGNRVQTIQQRELWVLYGTDIFAVS